MDCWLDTLQLMTASFVWLTEQNPNSLYLLSQMTNKSRISLNLGSWTKQMLWHLLGSCLSVIFSNSQQRQPHRQTTTDCCYWSVVKQNKKNGSLVTNLVKLDQNSTVKCVSKTIQGEKWSVQQQNLDSHSISTEFRGTVWSEWTRRMDATGANLLAIREAKPVVVTFLNLDQRRY